jgi:hypothetical protein
LRGHHGCARPIFPSLPLPVPVYFVNGKPGAPLFTVHLITEKQCFYITTHSTRKVILTIISDLYEMNESENGIYFSISLRWFTFQNSDKKASFTECSRINGIIASFLFHHDLSLTQSIENTIYFIIIVNFITRFTLFKKAPKSN